MKSTGYYLDHGIKSGTEFSYFEETLRTSIASWNYFVDWQKVMLHARKHINELNLLNGLIRSKNYKDDFLTLVGKYPSIVQVIPLLVAIRIKKGRLVEVNEWRNEVLSKLVFDFSVNTTNSPEELWNFLVKIGFVELLKNRDITSFPDYVLGVEVGIDTNGRKNRGGKLMEAIVEEYVRKYCEEKDYTYLTQANSAKIKASFGYEVPVDKWNRTYDVVVNTGKELVIFEANFYGNEGSKLKSTAGEYKSLYDTLKGKYKFVWITDGPGWKKSLKPLEETFMHNEYVANLSMIESGYLDYVFAKD